MKDSRETEGKSKSAKFISIFVFIFMCTVSIVIFYTQEKLDVFDYLLMFLSPIALSIFAYFVILHHDPNASD